MATLILWIRCGDGQAFKVDISNCEDVADLIEAVRTRLALADRLDSFNLLVMDDNGFKGLAQRPGLSLSRMMKDHRCTGEVDLHPLRIRKSNQIKTNTTRPQYWTYDFSHIQQILYSEWKSVNWWIIAIIVLYLIDYTQFSLFSASFLLIALKVLVYIILFNNKQLEQVHFT